MVHSLKWATSSWLLPSFRAFSPASDLASGPLFKVVHWLLTFSRFLAFFTVSGRASGPLFKVGHWLMTFTGFRAFSPVSDAASGPLSKVVHWLMAFFRIYDLAPDFSLVREQKRGRIQRISASIFFMPSERWFLNQSGRWRRDRVGRLRQRGSYLPQSLGSRRLSQFAVGPHCLPSRQWLSRQWTHPLFP